ncbi:MAG: EF-hand domain-containing protein, partial [archaeon]|nr:EF-hand domain-containing protein [archaeon]
MDDDNSHYVDFEEFKKACKDFRFDLTNEEMEIAFDAFDRDGSGRLEYDDFLRTIVGPMNEFRQGLVEQAFNIMDRDKSGQIDINDIKGVYNAQKHPDVINGKKTEDEVLLEFLETFEANHNYLNGTQCDNIVTLDEWIEYYENVSMSIDDDAYFELMMNNCWRMGNNTTYNNEKKGWSNKEETAQEPKLADQYNQKFGDREPEPR